MRTLSTGQNMPTIDLVALITGASRGIGRATAVTLAGLGYRLGLVARTEADLQETARLTGVAPDRVVGVAADITDPAQAQSAVDRVVGRFGRLDAVVNVAGLAPVRSIVDTSI